jgi:hypothetical protein
MNLTTITGTLFQPDGEPAVGLAVYILRSEKSGTTIQHGKQQVAVSDDAGLVTFTAPRASTIWLFGAFYIGSTNFSASAGVAVTVPDASTATLESLGAAVTGLPLTGLTVKSAGTGLADLINTINFSAAFIVTETPTGTAYVQSTALSTLPHPANTVIAGPVSGADAIPTARLLVAADIPSLLAAKISDFAAAVALIAPPGAVASVFSRTGAVVAAQDDYSFAQLSGKPTTLTGYGIGDAQPLAAKLTAIVALASSAGWLHNDGAGAFIYSTPAASDITQDATHRFATDTEKSTWNGKQDALGFTAVPTSRTVNGHALSADVAVTASDLTLGNVTNTSDANKPVSTAQQTALDLKANLISPSFTTPTLGVAIGTSVAFGLGATAPPSGVNLVVGDTVTTSPRGIMSWQSNTGTDGARLHLRKSRNTFASPSVVVSGDMLGRVVASGFDGTNFLEMGSIAINAVGTIASTRVPTQIVFQTGTDAAPSVLTTALTIGADQSVTHAAQTVLTGLTTQSVGQTTSAATDLLVNPTTKASGNLIDLQVNGSSKFSVTFTGHIYTAAGMEITSGSQQVWWTNGTTVDQTGTNGKLRVMSFAGTGFGSLVLGPTAPSTIGSLPSHGQTFTILQAEELLTIAASATSVTTMIVPAGAVILSVSVRVTTAIPTATTFTVTGTGSATVFNTAAVSVALNSTDVGTAAGSFYNASAQTIKITPNGTPADNTGRVRISVTYYLVTPPTS